MENKNEWSYDEETLAQTVALIYRLVKSNFTMTDVELSKEFDISVSKVKKILTSSNLVINAYPYIIKKLNSEELVDFPPNGMELFNLMREKRTVITKYSDRGGAEPVKPQLRLEYFPSQEENPEIKKKEQIKFLINAILTYRVKIDTLSYLFQLDENELYHLLMDGQPKYIINALEYLFNNDFSEIAINQEQAAFNLKRLYRNVIVAYNSGKRSNNWKEYNDLMRGLNDAPAIKFRREHQSGEKISPEELESVMNFHLKYALTLTGTANFFKISISNLYRRLKDLANSNPTLKNRFDALNDFNWKRKQGPKK